MASKLKNISADNAIEYYTNKDNIGNQELVAETIEYFKSGSGARLFKPIDFLNLLETQFQFVNENISDSEKVVCALKKLPLNDLEIHLLFGFLLKWFGGYPVQNMNEVYQQTLKVIQFEFLAFEGDTPEKEFCKADRTKRNKMEQYGIALTTALNNGLDVAEVLKGLNTESNRKSGTYYSFDTLFDDFAKEGLIKKNIDKQLYLIERSKYQLMFNVWLQDFKDLEYGNDEHYNSFLTTNVFSEFIQYERNEAERINFINKVNETEYKIFQENYSSLRSKFRIKRKATKEDCKIHPFLKEGDVIEFEPEYKTTIEAYTLLTEYYGNAYFELEKSQFTSTYKAWNESTVRAEILEIEKFINDAEKVNLAEACKAYGLYGKDNEHFIFKRFKGKFYENLEVGSYPAINTIGNLESRIYGRYFLFYNFLLEKRNFYTNNPFYDDIKNITNFIEVQNLNEEEMKKDIENKLRSIISNEEKIIYLKAEKEGYLRNLPVSTFAVSGIVSAKMPKGTELFLDKWISDKITEIYLLQRAALSNTDDNYLRSTIDKWLFEFKEKMSESHYESLISALEQYFTVGTFPTIHQKIIINGRINRKLFGWALNQIYRSASEGNLSKEYLRFAKQNISIFSNVAFDENNFLASNLYKYFTTKTQ